MGYTLDIANWRADHPGDHMYTVRYFLVISMCSARLRHQRRVFETSSLGQHSVRRIVSDIGERRRTADRCTYTHSCIVHSWDGWRIQAWCRRRFPSIRGWLFRPASEYSQLNSSPVAVREYINLQILLGIIPEYAEVYFVLSIEGWCWKVLIATGMYFQIPLRGKEFRLHL